MKVRFDDGSRGLYATDGSNYRQEPIGVVIPRHREDIIKTMHICSENDTPILSRGAGTSLAGQCCNTAVVTREEKHSTRGRGFLDKAEDLLSEILGSIREEIHAGVPVVGLEPSCVAVFRDELCNLMPHNEDAKRLQKQTFTLAEFLMNGVDEFVVPKLNRKAVLHSHCHHKAIMKLDDEKELLDKMNLDYELLDSGCCGMAGYFGYEKGEHYEVSIKAGERVLLPAVRKAEDSTLIITDGFSCREQIEQETDRAATHLAQVLQTALRQQQSEKECKIADE